MGWLVGLPALACCSASRIVGVVEDMVVAAEGPDFLGSFPVLAVAPLGLPVLEPEPVGDLPDFVLGLVVLLHVSPP
jgi:hypothetical protein